MQLKLAIQETPPPTAHKSTPQYSIVVSCNKCVQSARLIDRARPGDHGKVLSDGVLFP